MLLAAYSKHALHRLLSAFFAPISIHRIVAAEFVRLVTDTCVRCVAALSQDCPLEVVVDGLLVHSLWAIAVTTDFLE